MSICVVIPTYNIQSHRLANFKFVVSQLIKMGVLDIYVVEQRTDNKNVQNTVKLLLGARYVPYEIDCEHFNKAKLLNLFFNDVAFDYIWVLDVDVYLNYTFVLSNLPPGVEFAKPYSCIVNLTEPETQHLINTERILPTKTDTAVANNSFGKYSFIIKRDLYSNLGGMDERFQGWGFQDLDLVARLPKETSMGYTPNTAFHLYHPPAPRTNYEKNQQLYMKKTQTAKKLIPRRPRTR